MGTETNRRKFPRFPILVDIRYDSNSPRIMARVTDIGEGGIFVDTVNPLPADSLVRFQFSVGFGSAAHPVSGVGRVAWNQPTVGMGIEFTEMSREDRQRLKDFLQEMD